MIFATQLVFYLMVLFVRAANKGKYIFSILLHYSGSSWSYVKDLKYCTIYFKG